MDLSPEMQRIRAEQADVSEELGLIEAGIEAATAKSKEQIALAEAASDARDAAIRDSETALAKAREFIDKSTELSVKKKAAVNDLETLTDQLWDAFERFEDAHRPKPGARPTYPPRSETVDWSVQVDEILLQAIEKFVEEVDESEEAFVRRAIARELFRDD